MFALDSHARRDSSDVRSFLLLWTMIGLLAGCANEPPAPKPAAINAGDARANIERSLPLTLSDRAGWAADLQAAFTVLDINATRENTCAVAAVIEQESGFRVDPVIPGLPAMAWREIDRRSESVGVPRVVVHTALQLNSSTGRSYGDRIDHARTEKDLSDIYEDFIGAVPMGRSLFAERNPVRTRGPMQVNIAFAEQFAAARPYPYPVKSSIADEVFTRRGSVYFGVAHLLAYPASYSSYLYRFADFNAGQYASRNAAFQSAVSRASGILITPDGALLPHGGDADSPGSTELAIRALAERLDMGDSTIHRALEQGKADDFARTELYRRVFALAEQTEGRPLARALVPQIQLHGPKIARRLTTQWYAGRVDQRFKRCLANGSVGTRAGALQRP
jgi:Protein of unknown function (DUF1615)